MEALAPLIALGFVALVVGAALAVTYAQNQARRRRLAAIAERLEQGSLTGYDGSLNANLSSARIHGRREGREVTLSWRATGGKNQQHRMRYAVRVPYAVASFELKRAGWWHRLGRWLGVSGESLDPRLDKKYVLAAGRAESVRELFGARELEAAVDRLLGDAHGFSGLVLRGGELSAERLFQGDHLELRSVEGTLAALERVAVICERRRVDIKVQARSTTRFAFADRGGTLLCPYCRDAVDPTGSEAGACEACHTVHHAECLTEAGGCTVFGCASAAPRHRA